MTELKLKLKKNTSTQIFEPKKKERKKNSMMPFIIEDEKQVWSFVAFHHSFN